MRIAGVALALLVSWLTWSLAYALSGGTPLGPPSQFDSWVFFTPFFGFTLWVILDKITLGKFASGLWIFAISPILGAVNYGLCIVFSSLRGNHPSNFEETAYVLAGLWMAPVLSYLTVRVCRHFRDT